MPYRDKKVELGFEEEASFISLDTQLPIGLSQPLQVSFGDPAISSTGIVEIDSGGTITKKKDGDLMAKARFSARNPAPVGQSSLLVWAETRTNSSSPWQMSGNPASIRLAGANERQSSIDLSILTLPVGGQLRYMIARDASGGDSGGLYSLVPDLILAALGLLAVPSAELTIYRFKGISYK